jgi:hypothetical protein
MEDPSMAHTLGDGQGWAPDAPAHGGIFTRSVRRDLTDLNRQYLELGLRLEAGSDPLFAWSVDVRREIEVAGPVVRERMSACPFALFEIRLPPGNSVPGTDFCVELDRVEDRSHGGGQRVARPDGCIAFTHGVLFTAWRLADSAPLVARIAFGLSPAAELELTETCPTRIATLATHPGVVQGRWRTHARFWAMLRGAAQADSGSLLQWAHCVGICLMDGERASARVEEFAAQRDLPQR